MFDYAIVGGGIVGLATAFELGQAHPRARILLIEKESAWATHQTGHNSGVIHSGIYYKPGSAKARMAVEGNRRMVAFCQTHALPYTLCGKLIVASTSQEQTQLKILAERAQANGLAIQPLSPSQLQEHEPHVQGLGGLFVPSTGIIDYVQVAQKLAVLAQEQGAELRLQTKLLGVTQQSDAVTLKTTHGELHTRFLISCAGLYSDRVARLSGAALEAKIVPFRGEYYELVPEKQHLVRGLIYPVPNLAFPFLGVHFTKMLNGSVHAGPNAVLALAREGYKKTDLVLPELWETLTYPAFWKLAARHWDEGVQEVLRSLSKQRFVHSLQTLIPEIQPQDIVAAGAGVRAQALSHAGTLVDDFLIVGRERQLHVCNAPSPAATASLEIARELVGRLTLLSA